MRRITIVRSGLVYATLVSSLALTVAALPPTAASAANAKRHVRHGHNFGFLPGYDPPEVVREREMFQQRPPYWWGGPGFYRGRWNGGGFGPCWTQTPIGPHWNCG